MKTGMNAIQFSMRYVNVHIYEPKGGPIDDQKRGAWQQWDLGYIGQ